jgi:isopentenyl-diphosphate delta-isomerase
MNEQVSFDEEPLILVDEKNNEIGSLSKYECHEGSGRLHRAFSIFIVNSRGEILLQRRSSKKALWPNFWSNSCCSHPRKGETLIHAADRRLQQELGIRAELEEIYQFQYKARYLDKGSEHELCTVFVGHTDSSPVLNHSEVSECGWFTRKEIDDLLEDIEKPVTPWFRLEWEEITAKYLYSL